MRSDSALSLTPRGIEVARALGTIGEPSLIRASEESR